MRRWLAICSASLLCVTGPLAAAGASGEAGQQAAGYLAQLLGGLVLVIAAILVLAWVFRRTPGLQGQGHSSIQILAVRHVGARERLMLIQVGQEQVLVGVTPTGMRTLHRLEHPVAVPVKDEAGADFASLLSRFKASGTQR